MSHLEVDARVNAPPSFHKKFIDVYNKKVEEQKSWIIKYCSICTNRILHEGETCEKCNSEATRFDNNVCPVDPIPAALTGLSDLEKLLISRAFLQISLVKLVWKAENATTQRALKRNIIAYPIRHALHQEQLLKLPRDPASVRILSLMYSFDTYLNRLLERF